MSLCAPSLRRCGDVGERRDLVHGRSIKYAGLDAGARAHEFRDGVDFGVGERLHVRFRGASSDGVDLHLAQLSAGALNVVQSLAERFQFGARGRLAVESQEHRLDDQRTHSRRLGNISNYLCESDRSAIDAAEIFVSARFQFRPDFALVGVE